MSAVRSEPAKSQCDPEESRRGAGDPASVALGGSGEARGYLLAVHSRK